MMNTVFERIEGLEFIEEYDDTPYWCEAPRWLSKQVKKVLKERGRDTSMFPRGMMREALDLEGAGLVYDHPRKVEINTFMLDTPNKYGLLLQPYAEEDGYKKGFFKFCYNFGLKGVHANTSHYYPNHARTFFIYGVIGE